MRLRGGSESDPFEVCGFDGMGVVALAGVSGGGGFKEENAGFAGSDRLVLDAARDDAEFALFQRGDAVAKVDFDLSVEDEKKFVFVGVMMPDVFALKFGEFNILAVELPHHFWNPVILKRRELFGKVDRSRLQTDAPPLFQAVNTSNVAKFASRGSKV